MKINLVGIPSFSGALYSGTEMTPATLRAAGLIESLIEKGHQVADFGDVQLPGYLPRHNVPPIRNWPAPRMVWESTCNEAPHWFESDSFTLILGGDCSIVVGTADSLQQVHGDSAYLFVVDGHLDAIKPNAARCVGSAAMGLWFLACDYDMWWKSQRFKKTNMSVIGCQQQPEETHDISVVTLHTLREKGITDSVSDIFKKWPTDAKILVHFDVDVMNKLAMPAAYAPSETGLEMEECKTLLSAILADPRVIGMEVTEFSALRDSSGDHAKNLVQLLADVLGSRK